MQLILNNSEFTVFTFFKHKMDLKYLWLRGSKLNLTRLNAHTPDIAFYNLDT